MEDLSSFNTKLERWKADVGEPRDGGYSERGGKMAKIAL